ncbi:MAG: metal-dependent hydrolase [Halarchaeum sp.]
MYRPGHYGVSLLVYAPVLFALRASGHAGAALVGGVGMLALASVPDYDHRVPLISHREVTHTLAFAALVGAALAGAAVGVGTVVGDPTPALVVAGAFALGAFGIVAHLLGDVLTPAGIRPFWPLSGRKVTLSLWTADSTLANYGLLAAGAFAAAVAVALPSAVGFP